VNCDWAKVPTDVVSFMLTTSPERSVVDVAEPSVPKFLNVRVAEAPLAMFAVAALLEKPHAVALEDVSERVAAEHVPPPETAVIAEVQAKVEADKLPLNPALDEMPLTVALPRVTATAPTFRTTTVIEQVPAALQYPSALLSVNVANSIDILD